MNDQISADRFRIKAFPAQLGPQSSREQVANGIPFRGWASGWYKLARTMRPNAAHDLPRLAFAVRTTAASIVALYIAFLLDFEEPQWAPMTVWIVAQGSRGMSLSKSQYRLLGTLIGAVAGIALIAVFAQAPELFFIALAAWLAICTALSTALRNFRSYGAVLAGYTAAIISIAAANHPEAVFDIAMARVTNIAIGILVEAIFSAVFAPGTPMADVRRSLDRFVRQAATICARALRGENNGAALQRLFAGAVELNAAGEYAAASSPEARRRLGHLRSAIAAALAQLATAQALREHLLRHPGTSDPLLTKTIMALDAAAKDRIDAVWFDGLHNQIGQSAAVSEVVGASLNPPRALLLNRLDFLVENTRETLARRMLFSDSALPPSLMRFNFKVDHLGALQNGIRAFIALMLAAVFWIATAWSYGGSMVVTVAVICTLFSSRPNPVAAGVGFLKGTAAAVMVAAICNFLLLPTVSDFGMLAVLTAPFLIAGGIAMRVPSTATPAAAFTLYVWSLIAPQNLARADPTNFLNSSLALLLGIACGTIAFAIVLPADPLAVRRRIHEAVRQDLKVIGRNPEKWSAQAWLVRMADHFNQQLTTNAAVPERIRECELRGVLAALTIGHAAITLHKLKSENPSETRILKALQARMYKGDPQGLARLCERTARRLGQQLGQDTGGGWDDRQRRSAALFEDIAQSATLHSDFLGGRP